MMSKTKDQIYRRLPVRDALLHATQFINQITFACDRIAIAGSLRRHLDRPDWEQVNPPLTVGDIELVVIPSLIQEQREGGLHQFFDIPAKTSVNKLERRLSHMERQGTFRFGKNGKKYKELIFAFPYKIDLFIANYDNWGLIYMIRTGSNEFSKNFMIKLNEKGKYTCKNGYLWETKTNKRVSLPDEMDLFLTVGFDYIEPRNR